MDDTEEAREKRFIQMLRAIGAALAAVALAFVVERSWLLSPVFYTTVIGIAAFIYFYSRIGTYAKEHPRLVHGLTLIGFGFNLSNLVRGIAEYGLTMGHYVGLAASVVLLIFFARLSRFDDEETDHRD